MKIKRSMVILFAVAIALFCAPSLAEAATTGLPETLGAAEQLSFSPLVYVTLLLAAVTVCSLVLAALYYSKYQTQRTNVCTQLDCANNPLLSKEYDEDYLFDYRHFETPKEFSESYTKQSSLVMEEVIKHLASERAGATPPVTPAASGTGQQFTSQSLQRPYGKHARPRESGVPLATIALVPEAKHAKRYYKQPPLLDVPEELDTFLRKIS